MKRRIWLKDPETGAIWDLLPDDPREINGGCAWLNIKNMGFKQEVTQEQVETDYFVSSTKSKNISPNGNLYFNSDEHLENFQKYIGDFRKEFLLYYSPSGEYEPYDQISSPFYKRVIIQAIDKSEKDEYGWYVCPLTFVTQSDVWKRDVYYSIRYNVEEYKTFSDFPIFGNSDIIYKDLSTGTYYKWENGEYKQTTLEVVRSVGEALVYPYAYEYVFGGRDIYTIEIPNDGRETGCIITIKNKRDTPISQLEWFIENTIIDYYGNEQTTVQRSKWFTTFQPIPPGTESTEENLKQTVMLQKDYELYVDSNPVTQEAKVNYPDGHSQSVKDNQEPSWDYINFVRIKHGKNKIVFYVENPDVDVSVMYQEQKEII